MCVKRGGAARSARRAHNPQVCGSNPHPAITPLVSFMHKEVAIVDFFQFL